MARIAWDDRDDVRWIELVGELDQAACEQLRPRLEEAISTSEGPVVILLQSVPFMATTGITLLVSSYKTLKEEGRSLKLSGIRPQVRDVLETMNLMALFEEQD